MFGRSFTPRNGVKVTATTHEVNRAIQTTQKRFLQYSPALDCANPTGMRPMMVTRVPANIGAAGWLHAYPADLTRSQPSSNFTTFLSIDIISSSTHRPSER